MVADTLEKLFEHNNWANLQIIQACSSLTDQQRDAPPGSATKGSLRQTLTHLVEAQRNYLRLLTLPLEERLERLPSPPFAELMESVSRSGEALLDLARPGAGKLPGEKIKTRDGGLVEPWVILIQVINHATEHREQIKSMLTALGITPPDIDGWSYGDSTGAYLPAEKKT